jgi:hypothetical protein
VTDIVFLLVAKFGPEASYACVGADGDMLNIYYGAADTSIALATARVGKLLEWFDAHGRSEE